MAAYAVGTHRHTPEIEQVLGDVAGEAVEVLFTPHLIPMDRGILSTIYATPRRSMSPEQLLELYREYYDKMPFVRIVDHLPATKDRWERTSWTSQYAWFAAGCSWWPARTT